MDEVHSEVSFALPVARSHRPFGATTGGRTGRERQNRLGHGRWPEGSSRLRLHAESVESPVVPQAAV